MNISSLTPNFLRNAYLQLRRDKGLTVATILIMTLTLFLTSIFSVVSLTANSLLGFLESRPQITVFFKTDLSEEKIRELEKELKERTDVAAVNYISKEDAFKFYLGQHQSEQSLLESVSSDIFPPALEIKSGRIEDLSIIAETMSKKEGVEEVVFYRDVINTFKSWVDASRLMGLSLISVLSFISLFIILITVGMTIRSRSEEIEIMRLLGATEGYVRLPFLTQGSIYGLVSGLLSTLVLILLVFFLGGKMVTIFSGVTLPPLWRFVLVVSLSQIMLGILLGIFGAWLSTKRYLRI